MASTLSTIRSAVQSNLGLVSGAVSDADFARHINQVYRYDIPNVVGGGSARSEWLIATTSVDDGSYQFPDNMTAMHGASFAVNDPLALWTDYAVFYNEWDRETTARAKPTDGLIWGRQLILRPLPDDTYNIRAEITAYREALSDNSDNDEILDPVEGQAIEYGATVYVALQIGRFETMQIFQTFRDEAFVDLQVQDAKNYVSAVTVGRGF